jgi:predicted transcriptional regulator
MTKNKRPILTKLELVLMKIVWEKGKATVSEVQQSLKTDEKLAYSTVLTMLRVLEKKGFLNHKVDGRTYVYEPKITQNEVSKGMITDLLDRLFGGSMVQLFNTLMDAENIPNDELQQIRQIIDEKERTKNELR